MTDIMSLVQLILECDVLSAAAIGLIMQTYLRQCLILSNTRLHLPSTLMMAPGLFLLLHYNYY